MSGWRVVIEGDPKHRHVNADLHHLVAQHVVLVHCLDCGRRIEHSDPDIRTGWPVEDAEAERLILEAITAEPATLDAEDVKWLEDHADDHSRGGCDCRCLWMVQGVEL